MMKKKIIDLTWDETKTLIENNESLRHELCELAFEDARTIVEEWLEGCPCSYQIGTYTQGEFFALDVTKMDKIKEWFHSVQGIFGVIGDREIYFNDEDIDTFRRFLYSDGEDKELLEEVNQIIYKECMIQFDASFDTYTLIDMLWGYGYGNIYDKDAYTDEELKHIFVDVPRQIIEAHKETVF